MLRTDENILVEPPWNRSSLQSVLDLVRLQAGRAESVAVANALIAVATRVNAIMQIGATKSPGVGEGRINLADHLEGVCRSLHAMAGAPDSIKMVVGVEPAWMPVRTAQQLVLAVNELVVNAFRHGFPNDRLGVITVLGYISNHQLHLIVADDGIGMASGPDIRHGFGLRLARMMARRAGGFMSLEGSAGTRVQLVAPMTAQAGTPPGHCPETFACPPRGDHELWQ